MEPPSALPGLFGPPFLRNNIDGSLVCRSFKRPRLRMARTDPYPARMRRTAAPTPISQSLPSTPEPTVSETSNGDLEWGQDHAEGAWFPDTCRLAALTHRLHDAQRRNSHSRSCSDPSKVLLGMDTSEHDQLYQAIIAGGFENANVPRVLPALQAYPIEHGQLPSPTERHRPDQNNTSGVLGNQNPPSRANKITFDEVSTHQQSAMERSVCPRLTIRVTQILEKALHNVADQLTAVLEEELDKLEREGVRFDEEWLDALDDE